MSLKIFSHQTPFTLESGFVFPGYHLGYHTFGTMNADKSNVVWVFHALTANSNPLDWWPGLVGPGHLLDPEKYFIVCVNMPGSCYGSIGPLSIDPVTGKPYYHQFPFFTTRDMVRAYQPLKNFLGITEIMIGIGGSMGGQQLLEWAIEEPALFEHIVPIATNAFHSPWGKAFNASQRQCIELDPDWTTSRPDAGMEGMKVARGLALLSYRNQDTYNFYQADEDTASLGPFKSESYQRYQGEKLSMRFNAFSYYRLSQSMDAHHVGRARKSAESALGAIRARTHLICIESDLLFTEKEQVFLSTHIPKSRLHRIPSTYGHDGFLLEYEGIARVVREMRTGGKIFCTFCTFSWVKNLTLKLPGENRLINMNEEKPEATGRFKTYLKQLGPGLITGASDDDPSGIATYSQVGAGYGLSLLWMAPFTFPLMAALQGMCARIGMVTSQGLTHTLKRHYSPVILYLMLIFSVPAIILNIGADIAGMGAVTHLLFPTIPAFLFSFIFTVIMMAAIILFPYQKIAGILKWLCLSILLYLIVPFIVHVDWKQVLIATVVPHMELNKNFIEMVVAILGTTISPYLFFWQATMEAEDVGHHEQTVIVDKHAIRNMRADVNTGMFASNLVMLFIILTTGVVLYSAGIRDINTVDQAAKALEPLAGKFSYIFFALGVVGTGFLAIPVLTGSLSYMVAETFGWKEGLDKKFKEARAFYIVIIVSLIVGLLINILGISR